MLSGAPVLLDELQVPSVRETIGRLMASAQSADLAIARVRLAAIDLRMDEISSLGRCRLLLSTLDANLLHDTTAGELTPERRIILQRLLDWACSGRLELRSCGVLSWAPDFSVYHGVGVSRDVLLVGAHYFQSMFSGHGVALTCVVRQEAAVRCASKRFEELWSRAYDVLPVVIEGLVQTLDATISPGDTASSGLCDSPGLVR